MLKKLLAVLILPALFISLSSCSQNGGSPPDAGASPAAGIPSSAEPAASTPGSALPSATPAPDDARAADADWIEAYYNWLRQDTTDYGQIEVMLADLNFDGTPEMLFCFFHDGSYSYDRGLTIIDGQAVFFTSPSVSQLIGTITDAQGRTLWYGRDYPYAPQTWPSTGLGAYSYDFSNLPNVTETELLYIAIIADTGRLSDDGIENGVFDVKVTQNGADVPVTDAERAQYKAWYDSTSVCGDNLSELPHLARLEAGLDIQPQDVRVLNISGCYGDIKDTGTLSLDQFRQKMTQPNSDEQIPNNMAVIDQVPSILSD